MLNVIVSYWQAARTALYDEFSPVDFSIVAQEKLELDYFQQGSCPEIAVSLYRA